MVHARDSAAIRVARVLCIFFMMSVHLPGAYSASFITQGDGAIIGEIWLNFFGRASVAVLSLVSGFLLFGSLEKSRPMQILRDRLRVLVLPMITWNLITLVLIFGATVVGVQVGLEFPAWTFPDMTNALTGVLADSINLPLDFLRDLFVSSALLALLWRFIRRHLWVVFGIVLLLTVFTLTAPVVFRPTILLFMVAGCLLRANHIQLGTMAMPKPLICGLLGSGIVYLICHFMGMQDGPIAEIENLAKRVIMTFAMIAVTVAIGGNNKVQTFLERFEPVAFLAYLSHVILAKVIWVVMSAAGLTMMAPSYLIYFFTAPTLIFVIALGLRSVIDTMPAPLPVLLKGKKP